jgi:hypothetical protein
VVGPSDAWLVSGTDIVITGGPLRAAQAGGRINVGVVNLAQISSALQRKRATRNARNPSVSIKGSYNGRRLFTGTCQGCCSVTGWMMGTAANLVRPVGVVL